MKKRKILTVLLTAVITVGATAGVVSAVRLTSVKPVMVIPVTDVQGWDSSSMELSNLYGYVTGQGIQNIQVTDPSTVKEVLVSEGDPVKKGDPLIIYDQTQSSIALRKEKLKQESIELDIRIAKQNLSVLGAMRPYQEGGGEISDIPDDIPDKEDDVLAGLEGNVELQTDMRGMPSVDERSRGYFHSDYELYGEPGTEKNPEVFLCGDNPEDIDTLIDPYFLKMMKNQAGKSEDGEYYFTIETRTDNMITGEVQKSWTFRASLLDDGLLAKLVAIQESDDGSELTVSQLVMPAVWTMDFKDALPDGFLDKADPDDSDEGKNPPDDSSDTEKPDKEKDDTAPNDSQDGSDGKNKANDPNQQSNATDPSGKDVEQKEQNSENSETQKKIAEQTESEEQSVQNQSDSGNKTSEGKTTGYNSASSGGTVPKAVLCNAVVSRTPAARAVLTEYSASADDSSAGGSQSGGDSDDSSVNLSGSMLYSPSAQMSAQEIADAKKDENSKLENLELDLREEKIHLAEAQKKVDAGKAVAAFDGVVKHVGDLKEPQTDGTPFLTLSSTGGQFIKTAIPENVYDKVKEGDLMQLMSLSSGESAEAVVTTVSPYPDTSGMFGSGDGSTMYPVLAEVQGDTTFSATDTLQVTLSTDGMTADGTAADGIDTAASDQDGMQTAEGDTEPFYLNQAFVRTDDGDPYVYARNAKGRLEKRFVKLGKYGETSWQILEGLSMDDYIAFPYGNDVKAGAKTIEGTVSDLYTG